MTLANIITYFVILGGAAGVALVLYFGLRAVKVI